LHELAHFLDPEMATKQRDKLVASLRRGRRVRLDPHDVTFFRRLVPLLASFGARSLEEALVREVQTYPGHAGDLEQALRADGRAALLPAVRGARRARARARASAVVLVPVHPIVPLARGKLFFCATCEHRLGPTTVARYRRLAAVGSAHLLRHRVMGFDPTGK
jgi:hypothetical protein